MVVTKDAKSGESLIIDSHVHSKEKILKENIHKVLRGKI